MFQILRELSRGQPCDFSGVRDYRMLDELGGVQWPWPEGAGEAPPPERRLFEDGRFPRADGRARFVFDAPRPLPEPPSPRFPLLLLTGRGSASQWHTGTRTGKSAVLERLAPAELHLEISPVDAGPLGVSSGDRVRVVSQRAEVPARAFVTHAVQPGQVFLPMHFPGTNQLTLVAFDPHSRQPAYKGCAVAVEREAPIGR